MAVSQLRGGQNWFLHLRVESGKTSSEEQDKHQHHQRKLLIDGLLYWRRFSDISGARRTEGGDCGEVQFESWFAKSQSSEGLDENLALQDQLHQQRSVFITNCWIWLTNTFIRQWQSPGLQLVQRVHRQDFLQQAQTGGGGPGDGRHPVPGPRGHVRGSYSHIPRLDCAPQC